MSLRTATELQHELERTQRELEQWKADERELSQAYLRLRQKIPGAFLTPHAPSAQKVWQVTEEALDVVLERLKMVDQVIVQEWHRGVKEFQLKPGSPTEAVVSRILDKTRGIVPR